MKSLAVLGLLATIMFVFVGCGGEDPKAAARPSDVGYVPPKDLPKADASKSAPAKAPAK